jgi:hypothetical protein
VAFLKHLFTHCPAEVGQNCLQRLDPACCSAPPMSLVALASLARGLPRIISKHGASCLVAELHDSMIINGARLPKAATDIKQPAR